MVQQSKKSPKLNNISDYWPTRQRYIPQDLNLQTYSIHSHSFFENNEKLFFSPLPQYFPLTSVYRCLKEGVCCTKSYQVLLLPLELSKYMLNYCNTFQQQFSLHQNQNVTQSFVAQICTCRFVQQTNLCPCLTILKLKRILWFHMYADFLVKKNNGDPQVWKEKTTQPTNCTTESLNL
jgi:hypothetical protein